ARGERSTGLITSRWVPRISHAERRVELCSAFAATASRAGSRIDPPRRPRRTRSPDHLPCRALRAPTFVAGSSSSPDGAAAPLRSRATRLPGVPGCKGILPDGSELRRTHVDRSDPTTAGGVRLLRERRGFPPP